MWFETRTNSAKPFLARWRNAAGTRESRAFVTEADRRSFQLAFKKKRVELGKGAMIVAPTKLEKWKEFDRIVEGRDPVDVAIEWLKFKETAADPGMPLTAAVPRYKAAMEGKRLSPDTITHRDLHLARFLNYYPAETLETVTTDKVVEWLANLPLSRGTGDASPKTIHAHRASVARLFSHAVAARWCDYNPCDAVPVPDLERGETINILTIDDVRSLFAKNEHSVCIGRLALEAFGGLRYTSAARIIKADLNAAEHGITFPAHKHKTGRRHYVEGYPANMWAWIEQAPDECWRLSQRQYLEAKRVCFVLAGLKGTDGTDDEAMRNVLRHSFATYHASAHRDLQNTARLLTHHSTAKLYSNYMGRATKDDGEAYFEIKPQVLLTD